MIGEDMKRHVPHLAYRIVSCLSLICFILNSLLLPPAMAQVAFLPKPGMMVDLTPRYSPMMIKGMKLYPDNAFKFDFILDMADDLKDSDEIKAEGRNLASYFLAALTTPEKEMWVNLSPYEHARTIPRSFGNTEMGKEILAEDYILKQLMATALYPERQLGKAFWQKVYAEARERFGTTDIPINTFNKVWILPDQASVYENEQTNSVLVVDSSLKVMLERDYLAANKHKAMEQYGWTEGQLPKMTQAGTLSSSIIKEIILPALTEEVNQGKNFAKLRQIYQTLILAAWYKHNLKESILSKGYVDRAKTLGIQIQDRGVIEKIYSQYLKAYRKGVYNYIKEEIDPTSNEMIPRKYFSGGLLLAVHPNPAQLSQAKRASQAMVDPRILSVIFRMVHYTPRLNYISEPNARNNAINNILQGRFLRANPQNNHQKNLVQMLVRDMQRPIPSRRNIVYPFQFNNQPQNYPAVYVVVDPKSKEGYFKVGKNMIVVMNSDRNIDQRLKNINNTSPFFHQFMMAYSMLLIRNFQPIQSGHGTARPRPTVNPGITPFYMVIKAPERQRPRRAPIQIRWRYLTLLLPLLLQSSMGLTPSTPDIANKSRIFPFDLNLPHRGLPDGLRDFGQPRKRIPSIRPNPSNPQPSPWETRRPNDKLFELKPFSGIRCIWRDVIVLVQKSAPHKWITTAPDLSYNDAVLRRECLPNGAVILPLPFLKEPGPRDHNQRHPNPNDHGDIPDIPQIPDIPDLRIPHSTIDPNFPFEPFKIPAPTIPNHKKINDIATIGRDGVYEAVRQTILHNFPSEIADKFNPTTYLNMVRDGKIRVLETGEVLTPKTVGDLNYGKRTWPEGTKILVELEGLDRAMSGIEHRPLHFMHPVSMPGGIDLEKVKIQAQRQGRGVRTAFQDPAMLDAILHAQGLIPVVTGLSPLTTAMTNMLLGFNKKIPQPKPAASAGIQTAWAVRSKHYASQFLT